MRNIRCRIHSFAAKQAVLGRTRPLAELLEEHDAEARARHAHRAEQRASDAATPDGLVRVSMRVQERAAQQMTESIAGVIGDMRCESRNGARESPCPVRYSATPPREAARHSDTDVSACSAAAGGGGGGGGGGARHGENQALTEEQDACEGEEFEEQEGGSMKLDVLVDVCRQEALVEAPASKDEVVCVCVCVCVCHAYEHTDGFMHIHTLTYLRTHIGRACGGRACTGRWRELPRVSGR